jgi:hypothetical protein
MAVLGVAAPSCVRSHSDLGTHANGTDNTVVGSIRNSQ